MTGIVRRTIVASLVAAAIGCAVLAAAWAAAVSLGGPTTGRPIVRVRSSIANLGRLAAGRTYEAEFEVSNQGTQRLILHDVGHGCECLSALHPEFIVEPRATRRLVVRLDTTGARGPLRPDVRYRTNDPAQPIVTFTLVADVQPQ